MKAVVNADTCIGCGLCPQICPDVFEMNDKNIAVVKVSTVPPQLHAKCQEAADTCPVTAILLEP